MITLDFETYSGQSIETGGYKYMHDKDADIVCLAYKVDDYPTQLWTPTNNASLPTKEVLSTEKIYCHGALFDFLAWNILGQRYNFPELKLEQIVDTMALSNRYSLPSKLAEVGEVLELNIQKRAAGKALIKKICTPTKDGRRPELFKDYSSQDINDFYEYCIDDVDATHELINTLPSKELSLEEQRIWRLTQDMNLRGLPIDHESADRILDYVSSYAEEMTRRVTEINGGAFAKVTQVQKMRAWMKTLGTDLSNLQAGTVEKTLAKGDIHPAVREMLELRQILGRSSTAKYKKIRSMTIHGRIFDNLQYYGASTGRWTGRGFQLHNLPRATVTNPEAYIDKFNNFDPVDNPVTVAKALIRPMIKAEEGRMLIVSDYSAIENVLLMWVAGELKVIESIKQGNDQYVEMAAYMYHLSYDDIKAGHLAGDKMACHQRRIGKIIVLGCGFQMGAKRFQESAAEQGVKLSMGESLNAVDAFRSKHELVKLLWSKLFSACVAAIRFPGEKYEYNNCSFRVVKCSVGNRWLVLTLPSGRNVFYKDPYLSSDKYGYVPSHYGTDPYTKKWAKRKLIPGRITENIMQALARDIMAHGLLKVEELMPHVDVIGTVHDEAIGIGPEEMNDNDMNTFNNCLCTLPKWAKGLPLKAEGYIAKRYRKG